MAIGDLGTLVHGVHLALVLGGLVGMALLLAPPLIARASRAPHPADGHDLRVADLRRRIAYGELATPLATTERPESPPAAATGSRTGLPLAVVAGVAAAGVHAAVVPAHLRHSPDVVVFFVLCSAAQLAWSARVLRGTTPGLLLAGMLGNLAVLALWLVSRTAGVPGLPLSPEPFGPWDLACAAWELVVVAVCAVRLAGGRAEERPAPWWSWTPAPQGLAVASALLLMTLSFSGAPA